MLKRDLIESCDVSCTVKYQFTEVNSIFCRIWRNNMSFWAIKTIFIYENEKKVKWWQTMNFMNCNWTRTHNHLVHKRTLSHLASHCRPEVAKFNYALSSVCVYSMLKDSLNFFQLTTMKHFFSVFDLNKLIWAISFIKNKITRNCIVGKRLKHVWMLKR